MFNIMRVVGIFTIFASIKLCRGHNFALKDTYDASNFFTDFEFFTGPDPTEGFVKYVNLQSAAQQNLLGYGSDGSVFLYADSTSKPTDGRPSVRLSSKAKYNTGLLIADVKHMPSSTCGLWPALWMLGPSWPEDGEIDIVEGVNDQTVNQMTLHTSDGCAVEKDNSFLGKMAATDCNVDAPNQPDNVGCGVTMPNNVTTSYGTPFNSAGGGVYAMQWIEEGISIWFFPRSSPMISSVLSTDTPDTDTWGTPMARFAGSGCDFTKRFIDMQIIIDTTFCGAWAGEVWSSGGCAKKTGVKTCEEYVQANPEAFKEAFWQFASLKWYELTGDGDSKTTNNTMSNRFKRSEQPPYPHDATFDPHLELRAPKGGSRIAGNGGSLLSSDAGELQTKLILTIVPMLLVVLMILV